MPAKKPPARENISSRPTDSSGRRASNADLGMVRTKTKSMPPENISSRPTDSSGRRATDADLGMVRSAPKPMPKVKPMAMPKPKAMPKPVQVIRTTVGMKSSPTTKRK